MQFDRFSFGSIQIDGTVYQHDVIHDRVEIRKRKKKNRLRDFKTRSARMRGEQCAGWNATQPIAHFGIAYLHL